MNSENVNRWLSLAANIGVIAGIIFLAIEIRQNQESLDRNSDLVELDYQLKVAEGQIAIAAMADNFRLLRAGSHEVEKIWLDGLAGRELSEVDQARFMEMCNADIWTGATTYGRNIALGRYDLTEGRAILWRNQIPSHPGFKKCLEANEIPLRLWGYGDLFDAALNPVQN
jgi:hypothetical protein